jgi:hypothetical protein
VTKVGIGPSGVRADSTLSRTAVVPFPDHADDGADVALARGRR